MICTPSPRPPRSRMADELDVAGCDGVHVTLSFDRLRDGRIAAVASVPARRRETVARCADRRGCSSRAILQCACCRARARSRSRNFRARAWRSARSSARVMPRARMSLIRPNSSSTRIGDSPIEGSSISINFGFAASARARSPASSARRRTASRPAGGPCGAAPGSGPSPLRCAARGRSLSGAATPPSSRLCSTDSSGKMLRPCGT